MFTNNSIAANLAGLVKILSTIIKKETLNQKGQKIFVIQKALI